MKPAPSGLALLQQARVRTIDPVLRNLHPRSSQASLTPMTSDPESVGLSGLLQRLLSAGRTTSRTPGTGSRSVPIEHSPT